MKNLPLADPGTPDLRSPGRYLIFVMRAQAGTLNVAVLFGIVWMVAQALMPAFIGRAIDEGVAANDTGRLTFWAMMLLAA
ncbi:MAG: ABC transporter ATP-binding protein, partial [Nocardioidaceae bacterium]|nr:ABC transporter ATP-binding protein [Nocardioidaceae bacterium]